MTCLTSSPLLSESLRQLSTVDNALMECPKQEPLNLEVLLSDPTGTAEDDDFMDSLAVRQGVLLEVWDRSMQIEEFIGECWLPPLSTLTTALRAYVLELHDPTDPQNPEDTRPDRHKGKHPDHASTGRLHVEASYLLLYVYNIPCRVTILYHAI